MGLACRGAHAKRVQQPPSRRDEITQQLAFAALGDGVITTVAVAQGQNRLTGRASMCSSLLLRCWWASHHSIAPWNQPE